MKMFFKFHKNRTMNEEFDFFLGGEKQNSFMGPQGKQKRDLISKIWKSFIQNDGPNPHWKFQYFSSIRKSLKIGGTEMSGERRQKDILDPILVIFKVPLKLEYWTFWHADLCNMLIEVLIRNMYGWEQWKKMTKMANYLVAYSYSSHTAAHLLLQRMGQQLLDTLGSETPG